MGNATPWPVRRHVAIAIANCMRNGALMCPTRIRVPDELFDRFKQQFPFFISFFFFLFSPLLPSP